MAMVASEGGVGPGGLILGSFGLGAALPLVAVAYASRAGVTRAQTWLQRQGTLLTRVFGVALALLGVAILTGADKQVEAWVTNLLPDGWLQAMVMF